MIKQDKVIENNAYYPHTQIRKFKSSKDHQAKETVYSLRNLQEINTLASDTPVIDNRLDVFNEKKELHEKSLGKIKGWGNTIMGARNKRLAAAKEKAQLAEAERKRLDAEWAEVAERERQEALRRSRMMQKSEEPRFRSLHSQMLLSNVLMERDKQLEYKFHKVLAEKIHEKEETLNMRLQYLKALEKDKNREEMNMEKRLEFARGLKTAVDKKNENRQDLPTEKERGNKLAAEIRQEFEKEAVLQRQQKLVEASIIKQTLANQIQQKKDALNEIQKNSLEMEESNHRFNEMKNLLSEKRKEFTYKQATFRMMRSEEVAKEFVKSNTEADKIRSEFLTAMQQSHDAQVQERETKKAIDRQHFLEEKEIFEQTHKAKKRLEAEEEKLQKAKERLHYKQQAEQWKREALEIAEKKKQRLLGIKEEQIDQMKYHRAQKNVHMEAGIKHDAATKIQMQKDNAEFDEYAASVIEEWSRSGKNVGPILNIIEKERPGYTKARGGPKELDHFSRLGFVGRHLTYDASPQM